MILEFLASKIYGAVSADCPNVINLAIGMGMDTSEPTLSAEMVKLRNNCCSSTNLECNNNSPPRVTGISWSVDLAPLTGFINGSALPSSLTSLTLNRNELKGELPTIWPPGMVHIEVNQNYLTGDVSLVQFPSTLKFLSLGYPGQGNQFSGSLILDECALTDLKINQNWITDIIIADTSRLVSCDISNNPLLGNPHIAALTMCTQNGLYSPVLLPVTISTTKVITKSTRITTKQQTSTTTRPLSAYSTGKMLASSILTSLSSKMTSKAVLATESNGIELTFHSLTSDKTVITPLISSTLVSESTLNKEALSVLYTGLNNRIQTASVGLDDNMSSIVVFASDYTAFGNSPTTPSVSSILPQETQPVDASGSILESWFIYALIGGLALLCLATIAASMIFKNPKIKSKYGRKNSFGTLYTVNTVNTTNS